MVEVALVVACLVFAGYVLHASTRLHLPVLDEDDEELEDQWNEDDL